MKAIRVLKIVGGTTAIFCVCGFFVATAFEIENIAAVLNVAAIVGIVVGLALFFEDEEALNEDEEGDERK